MEYILILLLSLISYACTEQRDLYIDSYPMLLIKNDWKPARIATDNKGATVTIFPLTIPAIMMEDPNRKAVSVKEGEYDIMVFNRYMFSETETGFNNVFYRNTDSFDTFEAYTTELPAQLRFRAAAGEIIVNHPDTVATRSTASLNVNEKRKFIMKYRDGKNGFPLINKHTQDSIIFIPCRITHNCIVYAHVRNIKVLNGKGYIKASQRGFTSSVFMATRMPSHTSVTHQFNMNGVKFDSNSLTDGTISGTFSTFGPPLDLPDRKYELQVNVRYSSGREAVFLFDVTSQLIPQIARMNADRLAHKPIMDDIIIQVEFELDKDDEGEMDVEVEEWGSDVIVPVEIKY